MFYYIHTYEKDAQLLPLCINRLLELAPDARIIVANDAEKPIPEQLLPRSPYVHILRTPYRTGGNLNGVEMIEGMLEAFVQILEEKKENYIVKLDCDTWLNSINWLKIGAMVNEGEPEPDYLCLERFDPMSAAGDCYRISLPGARAALKVLRARKWPRQAILPEDKTVLDLILRARLPIITVPYTEGKHIGMHDNLPSQRHLDAWTVHCGEPCVDGTRAPRDFVLLRMRLLAAICKATPIKS